MQKYLFMEKREWTIEQKTKSSFFLTAVATVIKDSTTSIRKHGNGLKDHEKTVRTAIKEDLKLKSHARTPDIFLSKKKKKKRSWSAKKTKKKVFREIFSVFWPSNLWPQSSPDLNLLDYALWGYFRKQNRYNFLSKYWFA